MFVSEGALSGEGPTVKQLLLCFEPLPRMPKRETVCAAAQPVTLDGETKAAMVWAKERGLKWQTVKMRRMRGDSWAQALKPGLRENTYMKGWSMSKR